MVREMPQAEPMRPQDSTKRSSAARTLSSVGVGSGLGGGGVMREKGTRVGAVRATGEGSDDQVGDGCGGECAGDDAVDGEEGYGEACGAAAMEDEVFVDEEDGDGDDGARGDGGEVGFDDGGGGEGGDGEGVAESAEP